MPKTKRFCQAQYMANRRAAGLCNRCPGKVDGNGSVCAACLAKQRAQRASTRQVEKRRHNTAIKRACLRCDRLFVSEGAHNRLCATCREFIHINPTPEEILPFRRPRTERVS